MKMARKCIAMQTQRLRNSL